MITRVDCPPFPHSSCGVALLWVFDGSYSHAEFEHNKEAFDPNIGLYESAEARAASLRAEPGFDTGDPLYQEAVRQMTGAAQMARRIVSEYNAMSEFADQEI